VKAPSNRSTWLVERGVVVPPAIPALDLVLVSQRDGAGLPHTSRRALLFPESAWRTRSPLPNASGSPDQPRGAPSRSWWTSECSSESAEWAPRSRRSGFIGGWDLTNLFDDLTVGVHAYHDRVEYRVGPGTPELSDILEIRRDLKMDYQGPRRPGRHRRTVHLDDRRRGWQPDRPRRRRHPCCTPPSSASGSRETWHPDLNLHGTGLDGRGPPVQPGQPGRTVTGAMWQTAVNTLTRIAAIGEREGASCSAWKISAPPPTTPAPPSPGLPTPAPSFKRRALLPACVAHQEGSPDRSRQMDRGPARPASPARLDRSDHPRGLRTPILTPDRGLSKP
jgi:hypothetical protein